MTGSVAFMLFLITLLAAENFGKDEDKAMKANGNFLLDEKDIEYERVTSQLNASDDNLFWSLNETRKNTTASLETTEENNTEKFDPEPSRDTLNDIIQESSPSEVNFPFLSDVNENIVLPRNNCIIEIPVDDNNDLKIQIKLRPPMNRGAGKCCIALNGQDNSLLAVQITDIYLQNGDFQEEILSVVLTTSGVDFILRQYRGREEYPSLLLTESNHVYIILYYNITKPNHSQDYTHFNLEVFRYATKEHSYFPHNTATEKIHFTTKK